MPPSTGTYPDSCGTTILMPPASATSHCQLMSAYHACATATREVEHAVYKTDRRAGKSDAMRHARGDVIFFVGEHGDEFAARVHQIWPRFDQLAIRIVRHTRVDADARLRARRVDGSVFERVPAQFEKDALLWIREQSFARGNVEERGVETVCVAEHAARGNIARMRAQC